MCRFAPEISAGKEENRRNPDGFQDFLTQSSGNLWREAVCGDLISGSLNAILYWLNTGVPWRDLPERFGPWQSVYSRFRTWTKAGVWEQILSALIEQDLVDETTLMLDSTTVNVHQHASGAKKGDTTKKPDGAEEV